MDNKVTGAEPRAFEELPLGITLENSLASFSEKTVLVLGDVFLDEYLFGDTNRISPEAPVPILKIRDSHLTLGGAANTAANIASLGGKAILIGLIGEDTGGTEFRTLCAHQGLEFHAVSDDRPTIRKTRVMGQRQQLLRLDREQTHSVLAEAEGRILGLFLENLGAADIVVLSDYAKGFFTESACRFIIEETHAAGKEVVVDPRPEHGKFYTGCDYLTPNWKEAQGLMGLPEKEMDGTSKNSIGAALSVGIRGNILMTLGPKGMAYFGKDGKNFEIPTEAREVFDVSGAGDTVVAMFALALASGCSIENAVILANRAAGVVVGKVGTSTVTREEVIGTGAGMNRLVSRNDLAPLAKHLRTLGRKIVTLNG